MQKRGFEVDHSNIYGTIAGLVISSCVGLIVFALLFQVADHSAEKAGSLALINQILGFWGELTITSQGIVMIASFGLGGGIAVFIIQCS
jgi:thiol:disulfide interchange protein DsbD